MFQYVFKFKSHRHTDNEQQRSLGRVVVRRPNSFRVAEEVNGGGRAVSNSLFVTNAEPVDSIATGWSRVLDTSCGYWFAL